VKNSEHFIKSIQDINLQNEDYLPSYDVVSLFINIPVEEVLQVIRNRLSADPFFPECTLVEDEMELLEICLTTTYEYFQFEDKVYQQKGGMAMGDSLSMVVSNIFMEHIEEIILDTADHKPAKLLRYVNDTFVVWPHGPARLQKFLHRLNSIMPTIKFRMKVEANDTLPFLNVLVMNGVQSGPQNCTRNLLILVIISTSSPIMYIT
jgi:hypothetical protein